MQEHMVGDQVGAHGSLGTRESRGLKCENGSDVERDEQYLGSKTDAA